MDGSQRRLHLFNLWAGKIIPLIILAALGYSLYAITYEVAIQYLLRPTRPDTPVRRAAAIAIIVIQYFLTFFVLATWGRFVHTLIVNPGFIPRGQRPKQDKAEDQRQQQPRGVSSRSGGSEIDRERRPSRSRDTPRRSRERDVSPQPKFLDRDAVRDGMLECPPGLEEFYSKEVFICGMDGVPRFCNVCWNWKPDRTHHSGELGRCVRRYDHYCPWVGGAVSETNNKFFIQFVFYSFLYTSFIFVVSVWTILTAKHDCKKVPFCDDSPNGHWIGGIIVSVVFGLMAFGILTRFGWYVLINLTTVEDLQRIQPRHCIAIRVHESELPRRSQTIGQEGPPPYFWMRYPFPSIYGHNVGTNGSITEAEPSGGQYYYAILMPKQGMNLFDLGYWENFKSLMGNRWWDWFLPLRYSPLTKHDDGFSAFPLGKDFRELEKQFLPHRYKRGSSRRRRSRSRSDTAEK